MNFYALVDKTVDKIILYLNDIIISLLEILLYLAKEKSREVWSDPGQIFLKIKN